MKEPGFSKGTTSVVPQTQQKRRALQAAEKLHFNLEHNRSVTRHGFSQADKANQINAGL